MKGTVCFFFWYYNIHVALDIFNLFTGQKGSLYTMLYRASMKAYQHHMAKRKYFA